VLPAVLTLSFYLLKSNRVAVSWFETNISSSIRGFLGLCSSIYPFSLLEVLCAAAIVWLFYFLIRTIMVTVRGHGKIKILLKRFLAVAVVFLYIWGLFCWLWNVGYFTPGFAETNGLVSDGISSDKLIAVTRKFADEANELAPRVMRDSDGHITEDRRKILEASTDVYNNISLEFSCLSGKLYKPKSMLFSNLMSRTGYTGIYFALTGESNINTRAPVSYMPSTVAHELAHQLGVFAEDEANFVGIAACVTSSNVVYEYSGWFSGLSYLLNALNGVDSEAWAGIYEGLSFEVLQDFEDSYIYWQSQKTVNTGIWFLDNALTGLTDVFSNTVDAVYDSHLKSNDQELGLKSYGACVNLLVEYFATDIMLNQ